MSSSCYPVLALLLLVIVGNANGLLHEDATCILSKTYDGLPWPLLNPHSLDFLTTHGLHCFYSNQATLQKPKSSITPVDKLHARHCMEEINGVKTFLVQHPKFKVDDFLCPTITGNGKNWIHHLGSHIVDYYNGSVYRVTLEEYFSKDPEFQRVYSQHPGLDARLYVEYGHNSPGESDASPKEPEARRLYVDYSHQSPSKSGETGPIIKSINQQYISSQDTELRMIAGFNYGLILMKQLVNLGLTPLEAQYIKEQQKSLEEWAWAASSFMCTFGETTVNTISKMESDLHHHGVI